MNISTGELIAMEEMQTLQEEVAKDYVEVPDRYREEAAQLIEDRKNVDFLADTPLSQWARETRSIGANMPGVNRKERRKKHLEMIHSTKKSKSGKRRHK